MASQRCNTASYSKATYGPSVTQRGRGMTGRCRSLGVPPFPHPLWVVEKLREQRSSDEQLDALADGLPADGARLECGAAVDAGGVATLEHQLDLVVDADGAGDALLHLTVAGLQLL